MFLLSSVILCFLVAILQNFKISKTVVCDSYSRDQIAHSQGKTEGFKVLWRFKKSKKPDFEVRGSKVRRFKPQKNLWSWADICPLWSSSGNSGDVLEDLPVVFFGEGFLYRIRCFILIYNEFRWCFAVFTGNLELKFSGVLRFLPQIKR